MGNWFAYAAIVVWPLVAIVFFRAKPLTTAILWTILGGHMLLPVNTAIDFPMIPPFDKVTVPALAAFAGCRYVAQKRINYLGRYPLVRWLVCLYLVLPFITAELNAEAIYSGAKFLPGMTHYDALSAVVQQVIMFLPFFIGRQFFRSYDNQLLIFKTLALAGLGYSLLMLFEVRMSPQLHTWIYGYFPHEFGQQMRYGGFRPVVFMGHGLLVAFFAAIAFISATLLWQLKIKIRQFSAAHVSGYFLVVLVLCKSMASLVYGFAAFLLIKFSKIKTQLRIAAILALLALLYPTMCIMNVFPHQMLLENVQSIDAERAQSMKFRFDNEHDLLEHGREKFFFGWGSWGRNRLYDEYTGKDISTTDGHWIVTFGQFGWLGFIAEFGLLTVPVFRAISAAKYAQSRQEQILLAAHTLLAGIIIIDQIPNGFLAPWLWLIISALLGRAEEIMANYKIRSS
jgi:hypothetical protein